jgi:2-polyprenyl-6-methoxyphenol hydroxylase-like FAD-dependent oxidoreductase
MTDISANASVLIVGGGPCGLTLAIELGRRGISTVLVDVKESTAFNPQANATQARTMEHFRRLGFADEVRALGLPPHHPTDIAYFTRYTGYELARYNLPPSSLAGAEIRQLTGSWSAAELPHRVSQKYVEQVLRRHAEACPTVSVRYGWSLENFRDQGGHVEAEIRCVATGRSQRIVADYLVGADGARSPVRQQLGVRLEGEAGAVRDFMGGQMLAVYVRAPGFFETVPHRKAWMYCAFNTERRAFMASVDGIQDFAFHTQLRPGDNPESYTAEQARVMFLQAVGQPIEATVLSHGTWTAGYALVAEKMRCGRVFIGGDAAHLFTPAGGLGYNTAVEDAVNLGWKLAAVLKGCGGDGLLDSYEAEQRPLAVRNTGYARGFADSMGGFAPVAEIEDETPDGEAARRRAADHFQQHIRAEFNIPGITFGGRHDGSPIIVSDGVAPPPDSASKYTPTACPGGRAPHLWLDDGRSLYDTFGFEWTLLRLDGARRQGQAFEEAAAALRMDLLVVDAPGEQARMLYEADLALIRPDGVVAWRGSEDKSDVAAVLAQASGRGCAKRSTGARESSRVERPTA